MIRAMASFGGIDLGGTKIRAVVVDAGHQVLGSARHPTPTSGGPKAVAAEMAVAMREAAVAANLDVATLGGIGVGSPGVVEEGTVTSARNLPDWEGTFPLAKELEAALGPQVRLGHGGGGRTPAAVPLGAGRPSPSLARAFVWTG